MAIQCLSLAGSSTGGEKLGPLTVSLTEMTYKWKKTTPDCTVIQLLRHSFHACLLLRYFPYFRGITAVI